MAGFVRLCFLYRLLEPATNDFVIYRSPVPNDTDRIASTYFESAAASLGIRKCYHGKGRRGPILCRKSRLVVLWPSERKHRIAGEGASLSLFLPFTAHEERKCSVQNFMMGTGGGELIRANVTRSSCTPFNISLANSLSGKII